MTSELGQSIIIRFAVPSAPLQPFVTSFYYTQVETSADQPWIEDYLHPEWPNLRFLTPRACEAAIGDEALAECPAFAVTGPTTLATRFRNRTGRSWGIGLLPLGWAKFVDAPADQYADRYVDGAHDPAFSAFVPLARELADMKGGFETERAVIERQLLAMLDRPVQDEAAITAINAALVDSSINTVTILASQVGMSVRSLERLSRRAFGFSPKLLLRRQRFLRSLSQFMLDPSLRWMGAIDCDYHDQAHFIRDFRRFMGMSPTAYGALEHPFLRAAAKARAALLGEPVQGLHHPIDSKRAVDTDL